MRIRIAVASCKAFSEKTLPILIPSLLKAGVPPDDIVIFEGGHAHEAQLASTVEHWLVTHNSFEYTPLIEVALREMPADYWFLMHDTCEVGPAFLDRLYGIPDTLPAKVAMRSFPSMSMGAYRYDYLLRQTKPLLEARNFDLSHEGMKAKKAWGLHREDHILWRDHTETTFVYPRIDGHPEMLVKELPNPYGSGVVRRAEYFPSLDVTKYKSNWGQTSIQDMVIDV